MESLNVLKVLQLLAVTFLLDKTSPRCEVCTK